MFSFARQLVRHKVGVVAVIAFAVVAFSNTKKTEDVPSNPWSKQAPVTVSVAKQDDSFGGKLGDIAEKAGDYAAEKVLGDKDLNPVKLASGSTQRFENTASAMSKANGN